MGPDLEKRIAGVAADRESGASEILEDVLAILRTAIATGAELNEVSEALRRAQPSMAPVWNASAAALTGNLDRFAQRAARAPEAIARFASALLETGNPPGAALRLVTISYSGTVAHIVESVARGRPVEVACAEGRPALEGRWLASRLVAAGVPVTCYSDAALGQALDRTDAVLIGADTVAPEWFLNKSGTRMLAASAMLRGIPVYVAAGREKFAAPQMAEALSERQGPAAEIWSDPPPGVTVLNPYFERVPLELAAAVISDVGVLSVADAAELCRTDHMSLKH
jgi:translation initiation factor 2B subunit (eIF-2B alpha/beta/delta family)